MAPTRWLIWHRRDLRLADNLALAAAAFNLLRLQRRPTASGVSSGISSDVS
jgi:hypothetical protein